MARFVALLSVWATTTAPAAVYFVDCNHPKASDENPGTKELPFRTIGRAAEVVGPGDVVIVKAGVYRESVKLSRSGRPGAPITFRAEGEVIVKGSEIVKGWKRANGKVWALPNWPHAGKMGRETGRNFVFRREQVFCDGRPLTHVERREEMGPGTFWVDIDKKALYVWLPDGGDPNEHKIEVSVRSFLWLAEGANYVRLSGFKFEHCANRAQSGALELRRCIGWEIEDCQIEWANGRGLSLFDCADVVVKGSEFNRNGQLGVGVSDGSGITFERCEFSGNNWKGYSTGWEAGGVKVATTAYKVRFVRCVAAYNRGCGIWLDYAGYGHEIAGCVVHDNTLAPAGIHVECTVGVKIVNNICYRNTHERKGGAAFFGAGILLHEAAFCEVYHNVSALNDVGLSLIGAGRHVNPIGNRVLNNIFALNGERQVLVWDSPSARATGWVFPLPAFVRNPREWAAKRLNRFDYNLYFGEAPLVEWGGPYNPGTPDKGRYRDLREFTDRTRRHSGWPQEEHGLVADPRFVNLTKDDFRPSPDSPAIDRALPLDEVREDITGSPRPKGKGPDIGAYEVR